MSGLIIWMFIFSKYKSTCRNIYDNAGIVHVFQGNRRMIVRSAVRQKRSKAELEPFVGVDYCHRVKHGGKSDSRKLASDRVWHAVPVIRSIGYCLIKVFVPAACRSSQLINVVLTEYDTEKSVKFMKTFSCFQL